MNVDQIACFENLRKLFSDRDEKLKVSEDSLLVLCNYAERICVDKNQSLQKEGEHSRWLYFIFEGIVREHLVRADGKDITSDFQIAPSGTGSFHSFCSNTPCDYSITSATKVVAYRIECKIFNELIGTYADLCRWYAEIIRDNYIQLREHVLRMNCTSSEDRLREIMRRCPSLIKNVSSSHVASYLNMTPVHFSRAKNNILNEMNYEPVMKHCDNRSFS